MNGRDRHNGFTLVELLVVVAIIIMLASVTVPAMVRGGWLGGNPTNSAARDLFALLRASQVYATTHNVDAAVAYGIAAPRDSLYTGDGGLLNNSVPEAFVPLDYLVSAFPNLDVPLDNPAHTTQNAVLNSAMLIRRITIQELNQVAFNGSLATAIIAEFANTEFSNPISDYDATKTLFVPVGNQFGEFDELPGNTCVLINDPAYQPMTTGGETLETGQGLNGIYIIRYERVFDSFSGEFVFEVQRLLPRANDTDNSVNNPVAQGLPGQFNVAWKNRFPAHVFKKSGGLIMAGGKQRITLSVGLLPDADYYDRYMLNEDTGLLYTRDLYFNDGSFDLVSRDTDIEIFVSTGRVRVASEND